MVLNEIFTSNGASTGDAIAGARKLEIYVGKSTQDPLQTKDLNKFLSVAELERAGRFLFNKDRDLYILSHVCLKKILSDKTGLASGDITYAFTSFEKPFLANESVHFNLSHANGFFVIGISDHLPVGVDTENYTREIDWKPVSRLYFTTEETAWVESHIPIEQKKAFFTIWTRKEALLKAVGCGITNDLNTIDTRNLYFKGGKAILADSSDQWYIRSYCYDENIISVALSEDFGPEWHLESTIA